MCVSSLSSPFFQSTDCRSLVTLCCGSVGLTVTPEDVAEEIVWVALRPKHVQVAEVSLSLPFLAWQGYLSVRTMLTCGYSLALGRISCWSFPRARRARRSSIATRGPLVLVIFFSLRVEVRADRAVSKLYHGLVKRV